MVVTPSFMERGDAALEHTPRVICGRYLLLSVLGEGGMGTVYHAHDVHRMQPCALKMCRYGRSAQLLEREFATMARLEHPHCTKVMDFGRCTGGPFFSLEYLAGGSLAIPRSWSVSEVVQIGLQVLSALDYVHSQHLVHRDVKPHNILLASVGDAPLVKLCDFGIARDTCSQDIAREGDVVGSARYLSPEQVRGEPADPRSDLYALGVVLYELLAGRPPVWGESGSLTGWLDAHLYQRPIELNRLAPAVPTGVAGVVMKLLAKGPSQRYETASAAYNELAGWCDQRGLAWPTHPPSTGVVPASSGRRSSTVVPTCLGLQTTLSVIRGAVASLS